jgi:hypothetical protein
MEIRQARRTAALMALLALLLGGAEDCSHETTVDSAYSRRDIARNDHEPSGSNHKLRDNHHKSARKNHKLRGSDRRGRGHYPCFLGNEELGVVGPEDAFQIHGVVEVKCARRPRSHHMHIWLQRWPYEDRRPPRESRRSAWSAMSHKKYVAIPGKRPRRFVISYGRCVPGRWRLWVDVTGIDAEGHRYRMESLGGHHEVRSRITCDD